MNRVIRLLAAALLLVTCIAQADGPREIDWLELMPPEDLEALAAMGELDHSGASVDMQSALTSAKTVVAMNGVKGKLPGYVVPVAFDEKGRITELFLVPYFGACIHMPPPPPNQIIYIKPKKPLDAGQIWDAYWAIGTVRIAMTQNDMAQSAYSMELDRLELIDE